MYNSVMASFLFRRKMIQLAALLTIVGLSGKLSFVVFHTDKVWIYEEIMTNDDNLESNLLTSSLLKIHSLYMFCYKLSQRSVTV